MYESFMHMAVNYRDQSSPTLHLSTLRGLFVTTHESKEHMFDHNVVAHNWSPYSTITT